MLSLLMPFRTIVSAYVNVREKDAPGKELGRLLLGLKYNNSVSSLFNKSNRIRTLLIAISSCMWAACQSCSVCGSMD